MLLVKGRRKEESKMGIEIEGKKAELLATIGAFRPAETVLEVGAKAMVSTSIVKLLYGFRHNGIVDNIHR